MAQHTLFTNVRVFNGTADRLSEPTTVVVNGNLIESVGGQPAPAQVGATVIDGGRRVLMPGLIDAHWHATLAALSQQALATSDPGYLHLVAAHQAGETLLRGFTTVRDAGGPAFALKQAIDERLLPGPRIYPSGAFVTQTGGHGDSRVLADLPRDPARWVSLAEANGLAVIADGVDAVLRGVREQLMKGASQIKVMAGGGVTSPHDPLDVNQYTRAELTAAVEAAANWGTYVMVHAYTPTSVRQAILAGVRCIEHGHLVDEETVELMAERQVWWSLQPFLDDEDAIPDLPPAKQAKQLAVCAGTERAYQLAREYGIRLGFGTDILFDAGQATRQGSHLAKLARWFTPVEVLRMATSGNASLLAMSGERNPYPGALGVVAPGGYADLLVVDGEPLEDLAVFADPANLRLIMKDGVVAKNSLTARRA